MKKYVVFNIMIPSVIIILLPIIIFCFAIQYFKISEVNLAFISLQIKENTKIPQFISIMSVLVILAILFGVIFIALRKYNKNRIFLSGNIYGTSNYFIYKVAKILGFKKISLIRKPYYIMFKILMNDDFEIVELNKENENLCTDISIRIDESKFHNINNLRECNLIISDTYKINLDQIPETKRNIDTIIVERIGYEGTRISSEELINKVREEVIKINNTGANINLYMTTSVYNTYKIITSCFMQAQRDKIGVEIFQQDTKDNNKKFRENGKNILRRK